MNAGKESGTCSPASGWGGAARAASGRVRASVYNQLVNGSGPVAAERAVGRVLLLFMMKRRGACRGRSGLSAVRAGRQIELQFSAPQCLLPAQSAGAQGHPPMNACSSSWRLHLSASAGAGGALAFPSHPGPPGCLPCDPNKPTREGIRGLAGRQAALGSKPSSASRATPRLCPLSFRREKQRAVITVTLPQGGREHEMRKRRGLGRHCAFTDSFLFPSPGLSEQPALVPGKGVGGGIRGKPLQWVRGPHGGR